MLGSVGGAMSGFFTLQERPHIGLRVTICFPNKVIIGMNIVGPAIWSSIGIYPGKSSG